MFSYSSNNYKNSMDFIKSKEENNNNLINSKNNKKYIPFPTKCCICGYICSGYIYYNVICCDGCKHFFRRCVKTKKLYKCKHNGNCNVMNVAIKCKSCRFDKCILVGMVFQSIRGLKSKSLSEINSIIKQRRNELKAKGKFYENGVVVTNEINNVSSDMPSSLFINQDNEIINFLTLVEKNAQLIRNSPKRVPNWHYNSFNSFETLITRKENIIASSHEYLYQQQNFLPLEVIEYIRKNGFFTMPPSALMEDLLLIVDIGKTMPFFDHLDLNEKVCILTQITMPLSILLLVYHSYCKNSNTVILPSGLCMVYGFSGEHYEGDNTITKLSKKVFTDSMEPFNRVKLTEEEYVLLRAIIYSNSFTTGLSRYGKELLLVESEKYSKILMKVLQNRYGQLPGARRYSECIHLIQTCFLYGYQNSLFLNYLANVHDCDRFRNVMPSALINLCLGNKMN